jgi:hypothetical protein
MTQSNSLLIEEGTGERSGGVVLKESASLLLPLLELVIGGEIKPDSGGGSTAARG